MKIGAYVSHFHNKFFCLFSPTTLLYRNSIAKWTDSLEAGISRLWISLVQALFDVCIPSTQPAWINPVVNKFGSERAFYRAYGREQTSFQILVKIWYLTGTLITFKSRNWSFSAHSYNVSRTKEQLKPVKAGMGPQQEMITVPEQWIK